MAVNPTNKRGHSSRRPNPEPRGMVSKGERRSMVRENSGKGEIPKWTPEQIVFDRWHEHDTIPILEIHWIDAISTGDDWVTEHDIDTKPAPSLAIGYLTAETEHTITITALINQAHYANGITIPKGCILYTRTLTP